MFVYLINILLTCIYAVCLCTGKTGKAKKTVFVVLCALQCLIIASIRSGIGTDYGWYSTGFEKMAESGFSEMTYDDWEIGFIFLNKVVALFTKDPAVFIGICAALSLSGTFYLIGRYSKDPFMSVFLFLNMYLFYLDLNYVRQSIAMSIMCFAYGFLKDRKFWRFLLLCVIATTFHFSALYFIPVFFFTFIKVNLKTLPIYAAGLIVYYAVSDPILKFVFSRFHTEYANSRFIRYGVIYYYAIYPLVLCVGMVALVFYLKFRMSRDLNVLTHLTLMMGFWQVVMIKHALFERFSYYTMPFLLIAIPEAINVFGERFMESSRAKLVKRYGDDLEGQKAAVRRLKKKTTVIVTFISTAVLAMAFAYNMLGLVSPEKGVHGVLPFKALSGIELPNIDHWFKG